MNFLKDDILGIFLLSVVASIAAAYIYDHLKPTMNFFKDNILGIFVLSVAASIAATYLYERLKPSSPPSMVSPIRQNSVSGTETAGLPRTAPVTSERPTKAPSSIRAASSAEASARSGSASTATRDSRSLPTSQPIVLQPGPPQAMDIWTTSAYSYTAAGGGPGGGLNDEKLVVGGWGDSYHSLLKFDLLAMPPVARVAKLELFCFKTRGTSTVGMFLDRIDEPWDWRAGGSGPDRARLWWADRPRSVQWRQSVLPPCALGTWYQIDITDLYNGWQSGTYKNYGLQLRPARNDNRWNEFYSSKYMVDTSLRPRLTVQR